MRTVICAAALLLPTHFALAEQTETDKVPLKTTRDQASYALGLNIGRQLKSNLPTISVSALLLGIRDTLTNAEPKLTAAQCQAALTALQQAQTQQQRALGEKNKREGEAFLAANKKQPKVVTLASGLQYTVLKSGTGATPKLTDKVKTHYHGTLINGTVFDSSVERGEPISFAVGGVIRGWREALQLMKVGDKWKLFVPSGLAYGPDGAGATIGPHAVLIFEIELLGIE